jgi:surface polysaccharide O-acyltransferase-like enzyme
MHRQNFEAQPVDVNFSVDLIRTVAILLVILVHATLFPYSVEGLMTTGAQIDWWTTNVYGALANIGVPLFVMLSGVLLLNPSKADEPLGVFFKKRVARIALPLAFWTAAYFVWGYYMHGYALTTTNIIQGLLGGSYYHLWFLYLLVGLYLATPVLRVLVKYLD